VCVCVCVCAVFLVVLGFDVSTAAIDCIERLVSKRESGGTLNLAHSPTLIHSLDCAPTPSPHTK